MTTFSAKALNAAKEWNAKHPVGTRVRVFLKDGTMEVVTYTASIATVEGDKAVVMLKQLNGWHDIGNCTPVVTRV